MGEMTKGSEEPDKTKRAPRLRRLFFFLGEGIWRLDMGPLSGVKRAGVNVLRFVTLVIGGFNKHRCSLHAASLTYFTLMAIVPVLCLTLLLAKTLGAGDLARRQIDAKFDAMVTSIEHGQDDLPAIAGQPAASVEQKKANARAFAAQARAIADSLFDRIDHFNVRTLGWIGLALLLWSVISMLGTAELSFNEIWEVDHPRPFFRKLLTNLGVCLVVPVFAIAAASVPVLRILRRVLATTTGGNHFIVGLVDLPCIGLLITLFFSSIAFAIFLAFMPNAKVKLRPALEGGLVTAILFGAWLKICAVAQVGIANSSALYGSFAILPIVLAWIYVSWEIILFGAGVVYAFQSCHAGERV